MRVERISLWIAVVALLSGCSDTPGGDQDAAVTPPDTSADTTRQDKGLKQDKGSVDTVSPDAKQLSVPGTWVTINPGKFRMGSPASEPCREPHGVKETAHDVTLTRKFEISTTEVTQAQFKAIMSYNPSKHAACGADCPVEQVSWHEAVSYCNALSAKKAVASCYTCTGAGTNAKCAEASAFSGAKVYTCKGYRLPTEAEWEYAYRATTKTALYSGALTNCKGNEANANQIGWYDKNSSYTLHPVAKKKANKWGLFDMGGNVEEWCHDRFKADLGSAPATNPFGHATDPFRVIRGGTHSTFARYMRAALRGAHMQSNLNSDELGFRCVRGL